MVRDTLSNITSSFTSTPADTARPLTHTLGGGEVAVVYFRAGYTPNDYLSDACWEARLLIERRWVIFAT